MPKEQNHGEAAAATIYFEGRPYLVPEGISVAAAVLGHAREVHTCTNSVTGEPRGPYCLMGVCHECLVEIDGKPNQQACLTTVRDGMRIKKQVKVQEFE
jgi:predicted molibdopterin-dependent oxidoreductase YjgC